MEDVKSKLSPAITFDSMWDGQVPLCQPKKGYRFNLDAVLLAGFLPMAKHLVDLGCGNGVIGILALKLGLVQQVTGVEQQKELYQCAKTNVQDNNLVADMTLVHGDLRTVCSDKYWQNDVHPVVPIDLVAFNPPYFTADSGHASPIVGRDLARHERNGTLADFVNVASVLLSDNPLHGVIAAIVRAERGDELITLCREAGFHKIIVRKVIPRDGQQEKQLLLTARRQSDDDKSLIYGPSLIVHQTDLGSIGNGEYTPEVAALLNGSKKASFLP